MALFGFGKKNTVVKSAKAKERKGEEVVSSRASLPPSSSLKDVLIRPRITEKAANMGSESVYVFDVQTRATKKEVATAVHTLYKVTPIKINIVTIPAKRVSMRRRRGFGKTAAGKKAYVFLKKGEQIQIA